MTIDGRVVAVADFDADGHRDLLWRFTDGGMRITYLEGDQYADEVTVARALGDELRTVVGAIDIDGNPGAEIVLQNVDGRISIALARIPWIPIRQTVLDAGSRWRFVDLAT